MPTIDEHFIARDAGRRSDPLRPIAAGAAAGKPGRPLAASFRGLSTEEDVAQSANAARRQRAQLPTFAPLLEELELAGWSSHRQALSGNFHDWLMLEDGQVLVMVGRTVGIELCDPTEAALVAQSTWSAIRAHARHTSDAGTLLSLAAQTMWPLPDAQQQIEVAVALMDTLGGHFSVAVAGDCLAWRVRAATLEPLGGHQPPLGTNHSVTYRSLDSQLSLRERLVLVADNPLLRTEKMVAAIESDFTHLDAETHRRMTAPEALGLVRRQFEGEANDDALAATSVAVIRRR
jgi:phosphoserine phosphatase RsbU/P